MIGPPLNSSGAAAEVVETPSTTRRYRAQRRQPLTLARAQAATDTSQSALGQPVVIAASRPQRAACRQ